MLLACLISHLLGQEGSGDPPLFPAFTYIVHPQPSPGVPSGSSTPSGNHPKAPPGLGHVPALGNMYRSHQALKEEDSWSTGPCHESSA